MRPILMKGHERPLTFLKYNRDGDLLFSCAKDHNPTVWFADNGERLGTYRGHNGAVWTCDISRDSTCLITASADQTAKIWNVKTGTPLYTFNFDSPARSVDLSIGDKLAVITTDPFMGVPSAIHIKHIARDPDERTSSHLYVLKKKWKIACKTVRVQSFSVYKQKRNTNDPLKLFLLLDEDYAFGYPSEAK